MALSFGNTKGAAVAKKLDTYEYKDGENTVRLIGDVLPRYVYWVKGTNDKDIPIECLAFSREEEKFTNKEVDHVQSFFPDIKCSWAYSMNCIDPKDGKVKVINLKKKLFAQIREAAADLGDPTNLDTGWDVVFKKTKTGPLAYNIEYTLSVLRCKTRQLSDAEKAVVQAAEKIDSKYPRTTPDDIYTLLTKLTSSTSEASGDVPSPSTDTEAISELG